MSKKKGVVPDLRFPEFRDVGEWKKKPLAPYIEQYSERASSSTELEVYSSTREGLKLQSEYYDGRNLVNDGEYGVVPNGYFVYRHMSDDDVFKFNLNQLGKKIAVSKEYPVFKAVNLDARFLLNKLNEGQKFKNFAVSQKKWGTRTRLYFKTLRTFESYLPAFEEQQKIANCLTSVAELITAQTQKLDALKTHKKGLMQQLFPTESETVPKLRFPEFRDKGEWEEKRLGDFSIIVRGGSPRPMIDEYITKDANGLNWLKIGDIDKESKFVKSTQEKVIPAALSKTRVVNSGDLILSNSMSFGRPYILEIQTCIHDGWIAVSQINNSLDRDYLYYLMMTSASQTYFSNNAAGSGVQNLNADIIKLLPVSYPHKKEQQKIADCLTSIDELITAQTQKVESLKAHKKGLMQQLFPAMDDDCTDAEDRATQEQLPRATQDAKAEVAA